jgi:hypothetical protein
MKWNTKAPVNITQWHRWYAWHPVRYDGTTTWVWLEYVERKSVREHDYDGDYIWWEYRPVTPSHPALQADPNDSTFLSPESYYFTNRDIYAKHAFVYGLGTREPLY